MFLKTTDDAVTVDVAATDCDVADVISMFLKTADDETVDVAAKACVADAVKDTVAAELADGNTLVDCIAV